MPIRLTDALSAEPLCSGKTEESVFTCRRQTLEHVRNLKVKTAEPVELGTSRVRQVLSQGFQERNFRLKHLNSSEVSDQIPKSFCRPNPALLELCPLPPGPRAAVGMRGDVPPSSSHHPHTSSFPSPVGPACLLTAKETRHFFCFSGVVCLV